MNVEYINPFIEAVYELFQTMLEGKAERGKIGVASGPAVNPLSFMALIGISGRVRGTVALSFPTATALAVVSKILDMEVKAVDDVVSDGLAEVVNIVAGSAKARLNKGNEVPLDLSLPSVVRGNNFSVDYPSKAMWLEVPFTSTLGEFHLRVTFESEAS